MAEKTQVNYTRICAAAGVLLLIVGIYFFFKPHGLITIVGAALVTSSFIFFTITYAQYKKSSY